MATIVTLQFEQGSARTLISYSSVVELHREQRGDQETYKPPKPKMKLKVAFCDRRIWSFQISGIGRLIKAMSVMMWGIEEPTKNQ